MITRFSTVAAVDLASYFAAEGLAAPSLPPDIGKLMRPQGHTAFASQGWPGGLPISFAALRWLAEGAADSGAWCGLVQRGVHSTTVQVGVTSPRFGIFIRKYVSQAFDDGEQNRARAQGSFDLMRRVTEAAATAHEWPLGKRLAIIDDDDNPDVLWGWVAGTGARWDDLVPDGAGWVSALVSIESLAT
jgi:hypothetical protein